MAFNNDFERRNIPNVEIKNAEILPGGFRNFRGEVYQYNERGDRTFTVVIPDAALAQEMSEDGWKVRILTNRQDEQEPPKYILSVKVDFSHPRFAAIVHMRCDGKITRLNEETINLLDEAMIIQDGTNVVIRAYEWAPGKIKAYLDEMMVEIEPLRRSRYVDDDYPGEEPF